jgi:malonyl-CoA decarboxylase
MLDELRAAAARQRLARSLSLLKLGTKRLLSERGEMNGVPLVRELIERLDTLGDEQLDGSFEHLARDLDPDPAAVLRCAQAYAEQPTAQHLIALTAAAEPPRQELLRRLNRSPGGTAAVLRLRRALLKRLPQRPELMALEADLRHLLGSWVDPGFLSMKRVDWNAPAMLLERLILHEAVHAIDGGDDLRRRLRPEMPEASAPLIDKDSTPLPEERFSVAAFHSISNCETGLRGVSPSARRRRFPASPTGCDEGPIWPRCPAWGAASRSACRPRPSQAMPRHCQRATRWPVSTSTTAPGWSI